jgi:DNA (cytosine-5)-methyltransferase 1
MEGIKNMKYFSMFSGIGGFENGIGKRGECIGYSEIDKYAEKIYKKHYPDHIGYGDATKINTGEIPEFDLLVGGFPCQAFSVAGKRRGFNDCRGTLFFEIARVLKDKRPRYFLLENVKGLLSHDKGKTFQTILEVLTNLGYFVEWQVLNSKDFGVPQNRERVFIVGHFGGGGGRKVFPISRSNSKTVSKTLMDINQAQRVYGTDGCSITLKALGGGQGAKTGLYAVPTTKEGNVHTIDANYGKGCNNRLDKGRRTQIIEYFKKDKCQSNRIYKTTGISPTLPSRGKNTGQNSPMMAIPVLTPDWENKRQNGRRFKTNNEPSFTLTAQDKHGVYDGFRIRRLTPVECERLQGFKDNYTKYGCDGSEISDTQRYKCLGNAVTVNVVEAIIDKMFVEGLFE